jgi:hypothetical protein
MFIRSTASISPQASFSQLLHKPAEYQFNRLTCIEPDYSGKLDPKLIRRMSRIIKMGVAAAMECLHEAGVQNPDAIITGTAYGCLADTESFLTKMVENKEELLTPTAFIQSTHNTVAAQVALMIKCHNYNNTIVHRGFSFENALLDAVSLIQEGDASVALVGGVDEITGTSHDILSRFGLYRNNPVYNLDIFKSPARGTINGEGAAFFCLSGQASGSDYAKIDAIHTFYKPEGAEAIRHNITQFLSSRSLSIHDVDLVIRGRNGDRGMMRCTKILINHCLPGKIKLITNSIAVNILRHHHLRFGWRLIFLNQEKFPHPFWKIQRKFYFITIIKTFIILCISFLHVKFQKYKYLFCCGAGRTDHC